MQEYLNIFIDSEYPAFLDKYSNVRTLERIKHVTQYCGSDYTALYNPRFTLTRFDHSLIVAHITWHFTHDEKATIAAFLHDATMPCFAHAIDHALGDSVNQESSEGRLIDFILKDGELQELLSSDGISMDDLSNLSKYPILENKSPKLCADRLDGVLHTTYVWLNRGSLDEIKRIYDNLVVLKNEDGYDEIGFKSSDIALEFVQMTKTYALELQGNRDKFVTQYVADVVKDGVERGLFSINDLYTESEDRIVDIISENYPSWQSFADATDVKSSEDEPKQYYVSVETKKRNVIPLVERPNGAKRITELSVEARDVYDYIEHFRDAKYAFVDGIKDFKNGVSVPKKLLFDKQANM